MNEQEGFEVVAVNATDWGVHSCQMDLDTPWALVEGWIAGILIYEDDEKMVLAHHLFPADDQVRHITTIPRVNIISTRRLFVAPE